MVDSEIIDVAVVLKTQNLIGEQLTAIFTNFKKANEEQRRKNSYFTAKISEAEDLEERFRKITS